MRRLRKRLPVLLNNNLATISIFVALVLLAVGFVKVVHLTRDGKQAHDAICALKGNLTRRIDHIRQKLEDHPNAPVIDVDPGPLTFLVSRTLLISSNADDQTTLDALAMVKCTLDERKGKPT